MRWKQPNWNSQLVISKEAVRSEGGTFSTGFTFNVFGSPEHRQGDGAALGQRWMEDYIARASGVASVTGVRQGPFRGNSFKVEVSGDASPDGVAFNLEGLYLTNEETGALHLLWFESPARSWKKSWKTGSVIMNMFALETEY